MHNILLVAKREYLEQVRSRTFILSTVLIPSMIAALIGANYFLVSRNNRVGEHVTVATENVLLANDIRTQMLDDKDAKFIVDVTSPATEQDRATLLKRVHSKAIDGFLWVSTSPSGSPMATYSSLSISESTTTRRLTSALNRALLNERLTARGIKLHEVDALLKDVSVEPLQVNREGSSAGGYDTASYNTASLMDFILSILILFYGMDMARSVISEKSSRIFEVMLSVASPDDLLTGKLLGVGSVVLTQISIWALTSALVAGSAVLATIANGDFAFHFSVAEGILIPTFFVLGYLFYSALFSGLGATCENAQEFQMYLPLGVLPVWLSFAVVSYLRNSPGSPWAVAASLFPPTAPFVIIWRMGMEEPPVWQIATSIVFMILGIWAMLWVSTRLYRVGILMYGKRATLPELLRWVRFS
jgi:ABC-2 type transport system permease protein